ncbi:MAG: L-2-hydroxyglutarate oxidase [Bryobacterales bacterium]|jgi:L-2-hydroxyglutarate oxidase LhgO|nr:L-2-hydroxyglutarate oxidase [Bryobacterales bacterium]
MPAHRPPASIAIIGGGIIGLALACRALERWPGMRVEVLEKEGRVGAHQSGHNSNVLHCGLYYKPGSLKAKLAVEGIRQMVEFCQQESVPYQQCGKLVVAVDDSEAPRLRELEARGKANGLTGLRWLSGEAMREVEPHVRGVAALHVPEEGITDYPAVCRAMQARIQRLGGAVRTGFAVTGLRTQDGQWTLAGSNQECRAGFLFNCAGLHCDRVLALAGEARHTRIVPFRGEYFELSPEGAQLVKHLIYPTPDPRFPFLGVHFTRMIQGGVEAGPNAVLAARREGYRHRDISPRDLADIFTYGGFWRFLARYPRMSAFELYRSLRPAVFLRSLQRLVPALERQHLRPGNAGVRAQALSPDGTLVQDFQYVQRADALHLMNAPSPGATASLAIAGHLLDVVQPH